MNTFELIELNEKLDKALEMLREQQQVISAMGELLVGAHYVAQAKELHRNTISRNEKLDKFNEFGHRKALMTLESVTVVKNRKRRRIRK